MCQTNVLLEKDGKTELMLEDVTSLEVMGNGLKISTLFEGTKEFSGLVINRIDFSGGKVFVHQSG